MAIKHKQRPFWLMAGDLAVCLGSLWLALLIRNGSLPTYEAWQLHLEPFSIVFLISLVVFLISGLYDKQTSQLQPQLFGTLMSAQVGNAVVAILYFYFLPFFGITPKITLGIYLIVSTVLFFAWRMFGLKVFNLGTKEKIILIGTESETAELAAELRKNSRYRTIIDKILNVDQISEDDLSAALQAAAAGEVSAIVADSNHPKVISAVSQHYDFILSNLTFLDIHRVYEQVFDRVHIDSVNYSWIIDNDHRSAVLYDSLKRLTDLALSVPLAVVTFPFFPLFALAIKLETRGPVFITQERLGKKGKIIHMYKFRTMVTSDRGAWLGDSDNKVTKVGYFLRKSRIDELPQLINVIKGDVSLIGPRPDIIGLGETLMKEIPYYLTRYMVLPGLSGWAQIQQKPPQSIEENKLRFSYDLYYVKNRSFLLDLKIALRTIKTLLSRTGM